MMNNIRTKKLGYILSTISYLTLIIAIILVSNIQLVRAYCTSLGSVGKGIEPMLDLNINTTGWYGNSYFPPGLIEIGGSWGPQLTGPGVEYIADGDYYYIDTTDPGYNNNQANLVLSWYLQANESEEEYVLGAYDAYQVQYTLDNGKTFNNYCLNYKGSECNDQQSAEIYPNCYTGGGVSYGSEGVCQVINNRGDVAGDCVNGRHNIVFNPRWLSGRIVRFAVIEKFRQGVGEAEDDVKEYFVRYSKPIFFDINPSDYQLYLMLKGRNTKIDDTTWCDAQPDQELFPDEPALCKKEGDTYYLRNAEVYNYQSFIRDSRGNYLNYPSNLMYSYSKDNGISWSDTSWGSACVPEIIDGVACHKYANERYPDSKHFTGIFQIRSGIPQTSWWTKQKTDAGIWLGNSWASSYYWFFGEAPQLNLESNIIKTSFDLPIIEVTPKENTLKNTTGQESKQVTIRNSNSQSYPDSFKIYSGESGYTFLLPPINQNGDGGGLLGLPWLIGPDPDPKGKTVDQQGIVDDQVGHTPITFTLNTDDLPLTDQGVYFRVKARAATPLSGQSTFPGISINITEGDGRFSEAFNTDLNREFTCDPYDSSNPRCNWDYAKISYEKTETTDNKQYKVLFIGDRVNIESDNLEINYDSAIVNNIPPGFRELLAPLWEEINP